MHKILIVLFAGFLTLPGFSQEEAGTALEPLSQDGGQVIIRETPEAQNNEPTPSQNAAPEAMGSEDEAAVMELEQIRREQLEKVQAIEETTEAIVEPVVSPLQEIYDLGYKQLDAAALMDEKVLAIFQRLINEGMMSQVDPEAMKAQIQEKAKGTFLEKFFKKFPVWIDISVDIMRSKEALSGLLGIMIRKKDLKTFGYVWLAIFVFGALIKNRVVKPKWPFGKRILTSMSISLVLSLVSFGIFYNFFSKEISPTLSILGKHLL